MYRANHADLRIPLDAFVDFLTCTGRRRVGIVRSLKRNQGYDFYRPLVREVQGMHARAGRLRPEQVAHQLPDLVPPLVTDDRRKAAIFPKLVEGYIASLHAIGPTTWREQGQAPHRLSLAGDVEVDVAPDLSFVVEQDAAMKPRIYVVSLSFHGEPLADHRVAAICFLLREATGTSPETTVCGVLDVPRSRLLAPSLKGEQAADMRALVRAEAQCFRSLWESVVTE